MEMGMALRLVVNIMVPGTALHRTDRLHVLTALWPGRSGSDVVREGERGPLISARMARCAQSSP
jgi:hypothetical protein